MADLALLAFIAVGIVVALFRDRRRPRVRVVHVTITADTSAFDAAIRQANAAVGWWQVPADVRIESAPAPAPARGSTVIDETHDWADLEEMRTAWSTHWNDLMPERIEWETVPLSADDLARGFEALNYVFSGHLVGEADIETMPEGCWRTINHPDGAYAPCNQPPASDLGLCATHLDELASQGASR